MKVRIIRDVSFEGEEGKTEVLLPFGTVLTAKEWDGSHAGYPPGSVWAEDGEVSYGLRPDDFEVIQPATKEGLNGN